MLLWRKRICSILRNNWLTKSHRSICVIVFAFILLFVTILLVHNYHELLHNTEFISNSQSADVAKDLWSGKNKSNLLRRIWNIFVPQSFYSDKEAHHPFTQPFKYIINEENKCHAGSPFLILMIPVSPGKIKARQVVRKTWGNEGLVPGVRIIRIFLLGMESEPRSELQEKIMEESMKYRDIIQQEYIDSYHNLTTKVLMGMYWVATYCPATAYVMKIDSDMFLNPEYLIYNLLKPDMPPRREYFTGYIMKGYIPNRDQHSKWYMSAEAYPGDIYPLFCSGTGYVFSGDLAEKIYGVSLSIKHLPLEDVYLGICLAALGLEPVPPPKESDFNHWQVSFSVCGYRKLVTSHMTDTANQIYYWKELQQRKKHSC